MERGVVNGCRARLEHIHAPRGETRLDQRKDLVIEERMTGRILQRLGKIRKNHAVALVVRAHERKRIAEHDPRAAVLERAV